MDGYRDLRQVLTALRAGRVDPARLAEVGLGWSPEAAVPFWDFLVEHGVVAPDPARGALPATVAWQPTPRTEETSSLAGDGSTPEFRVPADPARDTVASGEPANGSAAPGPSASRYEVLRPHRAGGLGEVWLARDTAVGREVALKTIRPDRLADPNLRARFVREARTTGQLEHPCIVPLYDLMPDVAGRGPCYVMRFVAGRTLAEAVADYHARRAKGEAGRLDLAALLDAFVAVCRAVAFAHARGVLHRDLKGQNVVLGDFGEVFLLDWGLAKSVGDADVTPSPSPDPDYPDEPTRAGAVIGTPAYMAPEVAAGGPASPASDVYSLGAMMYAVLTGRPPYAGTTAVEVADKVKTTDPPPPRAVVADAPPALEAVCRRAMARDPARRYASADELATEVRRWLADEPVAAYRDPWTVRATRWARRHRTPVAAAAVFLFTALVALSTSTALVWREERRTADQKGIAEQEWKRADEEKARAELNFMAAKALVVDLGDRVAGLESGRTTPRQFDLSRKLALDAVLAGFERFRSGNPDDPALRRQTAALHRHAANVARNVNDIEAAESSYRESVRLYEGLAAQFPGHAEFRDSLAQTLWDDAALRRRTGRLKEARATLDRAVELAETLRGTVLPESSYRRTLGTALLERAEVEYRMGRFDEAEATAQRAADLYAGLATVPAAEAGPVDAVLAAAAGNRVALARREKKDLAGALRAHDEVVGRLKAAAGPQAGRDVTFWYARVRLERARTAAALPDRRAAALADAGDAVKACDELLGEYPAAPLYKEELAVALTTRGELLAATAPADATRDLNRARVLLEGLVRQYPDVPDYRGHLGRTCAGLSRLATDATAAADWHRKATIMLTGAVKRDPENALRRRALADLGPGPGR
ncbi:MAG TPA: serine/threonine-protein kinase [Fimbriiglobus sp.]|nr:serine/threonine-protein kinase [Fimbriiglobus sp.]